MNNLHEANYYAKKDDAVLCSLCPQACLIHDGKVGLCSVRFNKGGKLYALSYSRISSQHLDPIEKKPLYHFYPGSNIYSVGGSGCNLGCPFCQNWQIAQVKDYYPEGDPQEIVKDGTSELKPEELVKQALALKDQDNIGIAYTYNEPFIWFEYLKDCAVLAKEAGLKNILVTNGYVSKKPLMEILPLIDAMNIDLKGFSDYIYRQLGAKLAPVKNTIKTVANSNCHLEITNLLVTNLNDDMELFREMVSWIADTCGIDTPFHISRYFPTYKYTQPATSRESMQTAAAFASGKLRNVHLGNI